MFAEKQFGPEAVDRCLRELDDGDQIVLRSQIPMGWYPLEPTVRFMRVLDQQFGNGDLRLCREIGMFSAEWQVTVLHRVVLLFKPNEWLAQRGLSQWHRTHDTGRWDVEHLGPNHMAGRLYDFAVVDPAWCMRFTGFLDKAMSLTGAQTVESQETRCRARGDDCCRFLGRWS